MSGIVDESRLGMDEVQRSGHYVSRITACIQRSGAQGYGCLEVQG
jgi:hypothetical protein